MAELGFGASRPLGTQTSVLDHSVGVTTAQPPAAQRRQPRDSQTTLARVHSAEGMPLGQATARSSSSIALITAETLSAHPELRQLCTALSPSMEDAALLTALASSSELITALADASALNDSATQMPADESMLQTAAEVLALQTAAEDAAMHTAAENKTMKTAAEQSVMQTAPEASQLVTARGPQSSASMTQMYPVNTLATAVEYVDATSSHSAAMPVPSPPRLTHVPATPPYSAGSRTSVARSPSMLNTAVDYLTTARRPMESQLVTQPSQMVLMPVTSAHSVHPFISEEGVYGMRTAQSYGDLPASVSEMRTAVTPAKTYRLSTAASAGKLAPSAASTVYTGSVGMPSMMELRTANAPSMDADVRAVESNLRTAALPVPISSAVVKALLKNMGDYLIRLDARDGRPMVSVRTEEMIVRHVRLPAWDGARGGYPVIDNRRVVMTDAREWCEYHARNTVAIKSGVVLVRPVSAPAAPSL